MDHNLQNGWCQGLLSGFEGQNLLCDAWHRYFLVGAWINENYQLQMCPHSSYLSFSRSTYEAFKYYLSPASPPPASEDTLSDLQRSSSSSSRGESSSRGRGDRGCEGGSSWESVVTDLPLREPSLPMGELVTREQSRTLLYRDHRD